MNALATVRRGEANLLLCVASDPLADACSLLTTEHNAPISLGLLPLPQKEAKSDSEETQAD